MQMLARARAHAAPIVETPISVDKVETVPLVSDPEKEPQFLEPEPQFQHPARPSEILSTQVGIDITISLLKTIVINKHFITFS